MPEEPPRRGRPPRAEPAEPSGYRITAAQRRQLTLAMGFTNTRTLQALIDAAVNDYLHQLRESVPGFAAAVAAAETHVSGQPDNVTPLPRRR